MKKNRKIVFILLVIVILAIVIVFSTRNNNSDENQNVSGENNKSRVVKKGEEIELKSDKFVNCENSKNSEEKKEFTIDVAMQNDREKYQDKKKEIVEMVNQCYSVILKEAYEPQEGEVAYQQVEFKNKMRTDSDVFFNLPFYPNFNLNNYEGFLENGLDYVTTDSPEEVMNFYANAELKNQNFKLDESKTTDNSLFWQSNRLDDEAIKMEVMGFENATLVNFDYLRQFDATDFDVDTSDENQVIDENLEDEKQEKTEEAVDVNGAEESETATSESILENRE